MHLFGAQHARECIERLLGMFFGELVGKAPIKDDLLGFGAGVVAVLPLVSESLDEYLYHEGIQEAGEL